MSTQKLQQRFDELSVILLKEMNPRGFWEGGLSSSALGVAVAVAALHFHDKVAHQKEIHDGLGWLQKHVNADGSFGDTPESPGNVSTSLLVYAATNLYASEGKNAALLQEKIAGYLSLQGIDVHSPQVAKSILDHYKKDYTFSVPILTMCGLCGVPGKEAFKHVPQLPFELSLLPRRFYRMLNLSVVSYAIPALIAVGIVVFRKKGSNAFGRFVRKRSILPALALLQRLMPESGGFLEAIPLTAFVCLSLVEAGYRDQEVVERGISFLKKTQREDGSWPIDVDLSTWVTTLAVKALMSSQPCVVTLTKEGSVSKSSTQGILPNVRMTNTRYLTVDMTLGKKKDEILSNDTQSKIAAHLLSIQNKTVHPFNGSQPGGWGWTNHSGSVPDGDDTPGVILTLFQLLPKEKIKQPVLAACDWLVQLQNNDGGFPTFSKGWGKLPFDQSCADLTGHSLLAISACLEQFGAELNPASAKKYRKLFQKALQYLQKHQRADGSWLPLWFGNQQMPDHTNPVYGTAKVLSYFRDILLHQWIDEDSLSKLKKMVPQAEQFLLSVQNEDGSWGGGKNIPGTIEETALAVAALSTGKHNEACSKGMDWLDGFYRRNGLKASPIGLYFASLWYDEKMYPLTAYLDAVVKTQEVLTCVRK